MLNLFDNIFSEYLNPLYFLFGCFVSGYDIFDGGVVLFCVSDTSVG